MKERKFGAFSSSEDPQKLAMTWKGVLVGLIPVFILVGKQLGWDWTEADLTQLIEAGATIVASCITAYGVYRKLKNAKAE